MSDLIDQEAAGRHPDRLLFTLQHLLELQATALGPALEQACNLVAATLAADKVDALLYDPTIDSLIAAGTSDTPMGRRQHEIGMDRLPLANGGRCVEVFRTGVPHLTGQADRDPGELVGITQGLGIRSSLAVPLEVSDERRGVLLASSQQPDFFSEQDLRFTEAVARWVGNIAHRAELVERISGQAVEHGRRLAAEELITVLAHDLRNRITPLKGRLDLIRRRADRESRTRDLQDANQAIAALANLEQLISSLLDVARLDQGLFSVDPRPLDVAALAAEVAEGVRAAGTKTRVQTPGELVVEADPVRVRQALENLLANAVKHAPPGTPIEVEVAQRAREDGVWAEISVADRGPGVDPELLPRLFNRFAAGPGSGGLGLGLHLASQIALAHSGTLTVESAPGQGARFTLLLPAIDGTP